jgi:hypothetical protein
VVPSFEDIQDQVKSIEGFSQWLSRKEVKELPKILFDDERIEQIAQGIYNKNIGLLVATNKRIIFIDKSIFGLKIEDFPLDKITSIREELGMLTGKITIFSSGNKAVIKSVEKTQARAFTAWIRAKILTS